jgi:hypothetical protein
MIPIGVLTTYIISDKFCLNIKIKGKIKFRVKVKPVDYYLCAILPVLPERPVGDEDQPDSQRDTGYHQDGQHKILNLQKSTVGFIFK